MTKKINPSFFLYSTLLVLFFIMIGTIIYLLRNPHPIQQHIIEDYTTTKFKSLFRKESSEIFLGLILYYIDNKRFPSNEEGIVYGLAFTGNNSPYCNFEDSIRHNLIKRSNNTGLVKTLKNLKPGDIHLIYPESLKRLPPKDNRIKYELLQNNRFSLLETDESFWFKNFSKRYPLLTLKNLPYLRYRKIKKFTCGADYVHAASKLVFYLEKSDKK